MKKDRKWLLVVAIGLGLLQVGCGSSEKNTMAADTAAGAPAAVEEAAEEAIYDMEYEEGSMDAGGEAADVSNVAENRKLIRDVNMDVETGDFDQLLAAVERRVEVLGGYIENINVDNGRGMYGSSLKSAWMKIRIPKEKLDEFVTDVSEKSNVVSRSESTRDVTMEYVDLESHKKALQVEQERLLELLEKAESMEDIIAIEERLSQVRYELESMESRLRTYDNLVDFSTVDLSIREVEELTPVGEESVGSRMARGFAASVRNLGSGLKNFVIWLVICLPYLIFIAVLIALAVALILAAKKRRVRKLQEIQMQQAQWERQRQQEWQRQQEKQPLQEEEEDEQ